MTTLQMLVDDEQTKLRLERRVTKMMLDIGVPAHLNGFRYLR